jgi:2-methylisocitrate lyase-like PEP mutase family enzyme
MTIKRAKLYVDAGADMIFPEGYSPHIPTLTLI